MRAEHSGSKSNRFGPQIPNHQLQPQDSSPFKANFQFKTPVIDNPVIFDAAGVNDLADKMRGVRTKYSPEARVLFRPVILVSQRLQEQELRETEKPEEVFAESQEPIVLAERRETLASKARRWIGEGGKTLARTAAAGLLLGITFIGGVNQSQASGLSAAEQQAADAQSLQNGVGLMVDLPKGLSQADEAKILAKAHAVKIKQLVPAEGMENVQVWVVDKTKKEQIMKALQKDPRVAGVEEDILFTPDPITRKTPTLADMLRMPRANSLNSSNLLDPTNTYVAYQTYLEQINFFGIDGSKTNHQTKMAVFDTTISITSQTEDNIDRADGTNILTGTNDTWSGSDTHGGLVAKVNAMQFCDSSTVNCKSDYAGMSIKNLVKDVPVVMGTDRGFKSSDLISALNYVANRGDIPVVNISMTAQGMCGRLLQRAINNAAFNHHISIQSGAADNSSETIQQPAACPGVYGIASIDGNNHKSLFSGYGSYIDFAIPGENLFSVNNDGSYTGYNATSGATIVASGIAAIWYTEHDMSDYIMAPSNKVYRDPSYIALTDDPYYNAGKLGHGSDNVGILVNDSK